MFGRGSADQLGGVVAQVVASRILLELAAEGALRGVIVRSYVTVAEEDNDGAGPLYLSRRVFPGAPPEVIPNDHLSTPRMRHQRMFHVRHDPDNIRVFWFQDRHVPARPPESPSTTSAACPACHTHDLIGSPASVHQSLVAVDKRLLNIDMP